MAFFDPREPPESVDITEPLKLLDNLLVGLRPFEFLQLAFQHVLNELLGGRVTGGFGAALYAVVDLAAAEKTRPPG